MNIEDSLGITTLGLLRKMQRRVDHREDVRKFLMLTVDEDERLPVIITRNSIAFYNNEDSKLPE